jgi:hypothetical protein
MTTGLEHTPAAVCQLQHSDSVTMQTSGLATTLDVLNNTEVYPSRSLSLSLSVKASYIIHDTAQK